MKLFVLGSCRVHRPVKLLQEGGSARHLTGGVSGYIHSTREAVQRVRWLIERTRIDAQLLPFVFAAGRVPAVTPLHVRELEEADAVLVEAAAERSVCVDGVFLQKNLVVKHLVRGLGEAGLAWWRSLIRSGTVSEQAYAAVAPAYREVAEDAWRAGGARVLRGATCAVDSADVIRDDLRYLARQLGKPLFVVTHVDALRADGSRIRGRAQHVARVKEAAASLAGVQVIDPVEPAAGLAPAQLLDKGGADMNHYAPEFEPVFADYVIGKIQDTLAGRAWPQADANPAGAPACREGL